MTGPAGRASRLASWNFTLAGVPKKPLSPSKMDVTITFRTPARDGTEIPSGIHDRTLHGVPSSLAYRIADDFVRYRSEPDSPGRSTLYRYERDGEEVLVALDFDEVIAVTASEE
jgi:hypothetical protein